MAMEVRLPAVKITQIQAEARKLVRQKSISARMLTQLLGKMTATNCVLPPGPLFYRHIQIALTNTGAEVPMLRSTSPSHTRLPGRVDMVGQQYVQVERQSTHSEGSRSGDRF